MTIHPFLQLLLLFGAKGSPIARSADSLPLDFKMSSIELIIKDFIVIDENVKKTKKKKNRWDCAWHCSAAELGV